MCLCTFLGSWWVVTTVGVWSHSNFDHSYLWLGRTGREIPPTTSRRVPMPLISITARKLIMYCISTTHAHTILWYMQANTMTCIQAWLEDRGAWQRVGMYPIAQPSWKEGPWHAWQLHIFIPWQGSCLVPSQWTHIYSIFSFFVACLKLFRNLTLVPDNTSTNSARPLDEI